MQKSKKGLKISKRTYFPKAKSLKSEYFNLAWKFLTSLKQLLQADAMPKARNTKT